MAIIWFVYRRERYFAFAHVWIAFKYMFCTFSIENKRMSLLSEYFNMQFKWIWTIKSLIYRSFTFCLLFLATRSSKFRVVGRQYFMIHKNSILSICLCLELMLYADWIKANFRFYLQNLNFFSFSGISTDKLIV